MLNAAFPAWAFAVTFPLMKKFLLLSLAGAIALATVTASAAEKTVGTGPSFKGPLGLQLYSLRASFAKDVPGTLQKVREMGFKYVELAGTYNQTPEQFKKSLDDAGLVPIAESPRCHSSPCRIT